MTCDGLLLYLQTAKDFAGWCSGQGRSADMPSSPCSSRPFKATREWLIICTNKHQLGWLGGGQPSSRECACSKHVICLMEIPNNHSHLGCQATAAGARGVGTRQAVGMGPVVCRLKASAVKAQSVDMGTFQRCVAACGVKANWTVPLDENCAWGRDPVCLDLYCMLCNVHYLQFPSAQCTSECE